MYVTPSATDSSPMAVPRSGSLAINTNGMAVHSPTMTRSTRSTVPRRFSAK